MLMHSFADPSSRINRHDRTVMGGLAGALWLYRHAVDRHAALKVHLGDIDHSMMGQFAASPPATEFVSVPLLYQSTQFTVPVNVIQRPNLRHYALVPGRPTITNTFNLGLGDLTKRAIEFRYIAEEQFGFNIDVIATH